METKWAVLLLLLWPLVWVTKAQRRAFRGGSYGFQGGLPLLTGGGCRDTGEEGGVRCCTSGNIGRCCRDDFKRLRCCMFYNAILQCCNDLQMQSGSGPRQCSAMGGSDPFAAMSGQGQGLLGMQGQGLSSMQGLGLQGARGQGFCGREYGNQRGNRGGGRYGGEGQRGGYRGWGQGQGHHGGRGRGQGQGGQPGLTTPVPGVTLPGLVTDPSVTDPSLTLPGQLPGMPVLPPALQ